MGTAFKRLETALNRLDELQSSHIDGFKTQTLPDLEKQIAQRKDGFSDLKESLAPFLLESEIMGTKENIPLMQDIKNRILLLMTQNKVLISKVEKHKKQLKNSMKTMAKGRQMIQAYGPSESKVNQSKVINFRK